MSFLRCFSAIALAAALAFPGPALAAGSDDPPKDAAKDAAATAPNPAAAKEEPKKEEAAKDKPAEPATPAKSDKKSDWRDGYRVAVSLIQGGRYDDAIVKLKSLDKPDSPDVLNYIGFAHRKMGRMEAARVSYEGALALDPGHRGVLEYFGEWHVTMGRIDDAEAHLVRLASICGTSCREYQDLADAIAAAQVH